MNGRDWRLPLRILRVRLMGHDAHYRWQREQQWRYDPRCYLCGVVTVLPVRQPPGSVPPDNEASLDHVDSRLSGERGQHAGEFRRLLCCRRCNQERAQAEDARLPIQRKWEASGAMHHIARLSGALNEVGSGWHR